MLGQSLNSVAFVVKKILIAKRIIPPIKTTSHSMVIISANVLFGEGDSSGKNLTIVAGQETRRSDYIFPWPLCLNKTLTTSFAGKNILCGGLFIGMKY
jgi:hypothetical protein